MNLNFALLYGGALLVSAAIGGFGSMWADFHGYPECQEAPINATSVRCPPFVSAAKDIFLGLLWGSFIAMPAIIVLPTDRQRVNHQ